MAFRLTVLVSLSESRFADVAIVYLISHLVAVSLFINSSTFIHFNFVFTYTFLVHCSATRRHMNTDGDAVVDISEKLRSRWNKPLEVPLVGLHDYLNSPLDHEEKIPISNSNWQRLLLEKPGALEHVCYAADLKFLFRVSEDEEADFIWSHVLEAIVCPSPNLTGTEDSFHSFWDDNIRKILCTSLNIGSWIRNSNKNTYSGTLMPDFGLLLGDRCLFRGEEKRPSYDGLDPLEELTQKTRWVYDPAPYILGV